MCVSLNTLHVKQRVEKDKRKSCSTFHSSRIKHTDFFQYSGSSGVQMEYRFCEYIFMQMYLWILISYWRTICLHFKGSKMSAVSVVPHLIRTCEAGELKEVTHLKTADSNNMTE